ncbi:hypothetical protein O181_056504 [Austropuccinia psidii MF-1]|uniref:Transposable element Tc3 transposase n=1 Tax=Austropuccinia psidii MF-1 TaxID=1389203 RepID=A0A9Q3HVQ4_9BASI|nr:hypothetical protein [Austropuccinia psidii MF-1]
MSHTCRIGGYNSKGDFKSYCQQRNPQPWQTIVCGTQKTLPMTSRSCSLLGICSEASCVESPSMGRIIWTNECSFELGKKSDQVQVWQTPNKKYDLANLQVNHQSGHRSIMIWACFIGSTKGPLVFLNGPLNAAAFIEQVYDPALLPFLNQMANAPYIQGRQNITMMEDGAPIHTARL